MVPWGLLDFTPSVGHPPHLGDKTLGSLREVFVDLLVKSVEFQVEQSTPYDPLLKGFTEIRFEACSTLFVESFQTRCSFGEPFVRHGPLRILHPPPPQNPRFGDARRLPRRTQFPPRPRNEDASRAIRRFFSWLHADAIPPR